MHCKKCKEESKSLSIISKEEIRRGEESAVGSYCDFCFPIIWKALKERRKK